MDNDEIDVFDLGETSKLSTTLNGTDVNSNISMNQSIDEINSSIILDTADRSIEHNKSTSIEPIPIYSKLEKVFRRYCDITSRKHANISTENAKPSSSVLDIEKLPVALKQFYLDKQANRGKLFGAFTDNWSASTEKSQLKLCQLMSLLADTCDKVALTESSAIDFGIIDVIEKPKPRDAIAAVPIDSQLSLSLHLNNPTQIASQPEAHMPAMISDMPAMTSSTPNKMSIIRHEMPIDSPISNYTMPKPPTERSMEPKKRPNYLEYLGLHTIDDLFSSFEEQPIQEKSRSCSKLSRQLEFGDDEIIEQSQYTVSAIMKICNDAEGEVDTASHDTSMAQRKQLHIGNIDNLFSDCSNDGSDCTVDYDIVEAMCKQPDDEHSPRNTSCAGNDTNGKNVTRSKSDDLFSTYNESNANINITRDNTKCHTKPLTEMDRSERREKTPDPPPATLNLSIYRCRSPSMLIKSTSVISKSQAYRPNNTTLNETLNRTGSSTSDKNASILGEKLNFLNSQLSISRHFDDSDESKENVALSFATCQSTVAKASTNQYDVDTDFEDDDIFATCQPMPVI